MSLDLYRQRLGLEHFPSLDPQGLAALQHAHRLAIPFENLDIPLGRGIRIDAVSVFDKLVRARRGGYCFEQNRLFADMLGLLGVEVRSLLARVLLNMPEDHVPPRTHVLLLAQIAGQDFVLDVGFGGSDMPPLPLCDGASATTPDGAQHRLRRTGSLAGEWLLERAGTQATTDGRATTSTDWQAQYAFDLVHVAADDLAQANHWTATRPDTRFTTLHLATRVLPDGFATLVDRQLNVTRGRNSEACEIADPEQWRGVLADIFSIALPPEEVARLPLFRT